MFKHICGLAAGAALALTAMAAEAATITRTYSFEMSGYAGVLGTPAPIDPVSGSFTVTFDPSVAVSNVTSGLTVHHVNVSVAGPYAFSFTPFGMLSFYGAVNAGGASFGTDDFYVGFFQPLNETTPIAPSSFYTRAGVNDGWSTSVGTVHARTVPEPGVWALMIMGFGAAGARLRRRRTLPA